MDYRPNFFIVGQPKSGTTALHSMLNQHPEIYMSQDKEPRYFCHDLRNEALNRSKFFLHKFKYGSEREYLQLFANNKRYKIIGESTTTYLFSRVAAKEIYNFNPDSRIIMILRNPVHYLISLHSQLLKTGLESEYLFTKAFMLEASRKTGLNIPNNTDTPSLLYYSELIKYAEQVSRYSDRFKRDQIKILIYEDFKDDNVGTIKSVLEFLDVDCSFEPKTIKVNLEKLPRSKILNDLAFSSTFKRSLQVLLPSKLLLNNSVRNFVRYILWKEKEKEPLPEEFISQLYTLILPEVEKISELLKMDLVRKWGFDKYQ